MKHISDKTGKTLLSILFMMLLYTGSVFASPARRTPIEMPLPDGSTVTVQLNGDEFAHYYTSTDSYLLLKGEDGFFYYAEQDKDGNLVSSNFKAKNVDIRTQSENNFLSTVNTEQLIKLQQQNVAKNRRLTRNVKQNVSYPTMGKQKCLIILVEFKDEHFYTENPYEAFNNMLNQEGYSDNGGTGSARDYFIENSSGQFLPEFDVYGPVRLDKPMKYYGEDVGANDRASGRDGDRCLL